MQKRLFSELGLSEPILKAVEKLGFEQTSPIQSAAIPVLMSGKDVVGQSATGSGKTAAFAIPAIERVADAARKVQILVLTPTRELATQVAEEFARLSLFRPKVHAVPIYGGASYDRQFSELRKGPQIVIGTPGRVIDHLQRNTLDLSDVKMAVLDECDRMLDMGFREDMERILSATPPERQTVFFSATLPPPIKRLIEQFSRSPEHVRIETQSVTVPTVEQVYFDVPPRAKLDALTRLIDVHDARLSLVFANTQRTVDDLADALIARGYAADRLHGGISQMLRTRTMAKFKKSEFDILVATDVAGRGIDVDNLDLVINFDLPYDPEDYVHRVGRTGRAGRKGVALTLISGREVYRLQNVERFTRQRIRRGYVPTWDQVEEKRMSGVLDKIRAALENGSHSPHAIHIDRLMDEGHAATDLAAAMLHRLLEEEGIETQKPGASDPFARRDAIPAKAATPAAAAPAPARAETKPVAPAKTPAKTSAERPAARAADSATPATAADEDPDQQVRSGSTTDSEPPAETETEPVKTPSPKVGKKSLAKAARATAASAGEPESAEKLEPESEAHPETEAETETEMDLPVPAEPTLTNAPQADDDEAAEDSISEDTHSPDVPEEGLLTPSEEPVERPARPAARKESSAGSAASDKKTASIRENAEAPASRPAAPRERKPAADELPVEGKKKKSHEGARQLPAPASGYKWITLSLGRNDGMLPRDIVDAITEGGGLEGKAVGLIKIHDTESDVQVRTEHATEIVEALNGGNFEGKKVNVFFARTAVSPWEKKGGKSSDRGGYGGARPGGFGGKPGGYRKPGGYGSGPRPPYGGGGPGGNRSAEDRSPLAGGGPGEGPRPGGARPFRSDDRRPPGAGGNFRKREDGRGGPPKRYGSPKKGPGRW